MVRPSAASTSAGRAARRSAWRRTCAAKSASGISGAGRGLLITAGEAIGCMTTPRCVERLVPELMLRLGLSTVRYDSDHVKRAPRHDVVRGARQHRDPRAVHVL